MGEVEIWEVMTVFTTTNRFGSDDDAGQDLWNV